MNIGILIGKMVLFAGVYIVIGWNFIIPFIDSIQRESIELFILRVNI